VAVAAGGSYLIRGSGIKLIPDFVIGDRHSGGFEWTLVELESPTAAMFNAKGDPSATLQHALRQLTDWRTWLEVNQNYAARPRRDAGLGLTDISSNAQGLVLIGRTDNRDDGVVARPSVATFGEASALL